MKKGFLFVAVFVWLPLLALAQDTTQTTTQTTTTTTQTTTTSSTHVQYTPAQLKWGDAPPGFPKGSHLSVLSGDPGAAGLFTVRLRMPAGYKIAPHWHPTDEHVTVISGTFQVGMGDAYSTTALKSMPVGSYVLLPAEMRHFARAKTAAVVQVHGMGPFTITYVNPSDDPRNPVGAK